jgi:hypothetical protein
MLRKKYQEQFVGKQKSEEINKIHKDVDAIFYLFEELYNETNKQSEHLNTIENLIEDSKIKNEEVINDLQESNNTNPLKKYFVCSLSGSILGTVVGTIIYISNPYLIGISGLIGGISGGIIGNFVKMDN